MSSLHPAQLQPYALNGAGAVAGATSLTLKSFQTIAGVNLTLADFGTIGYGTLDPGNGTLEEQISFTGVVQNSNGTATLSGVKTVLMLSPYTETSGLAQTHAGSTPFVISNTAGFYNSIPFKQNDETITGQWTFSVFPITPAVSDASTTVKGVTKLSTAPASAANPIAVADTDPRIAPNNYGVSAAGSDTYAITLTTAPTAYATGQQYTFKADVANTGAATLNVNALGAKSIINADGSALADSTIAASQVVDVIYDGTSFRLLQPTVFSTDYQVFTASGSWSKPAGLSGNEMVIVQAWGAGGGGSVPSINRGGGGGGGSYATITAPASAFSSPVTVTVPGTTSAGAAGGNATFGTYLTAYGGGAAVSGLNAPSGGGGGGALSVGTNSTAGAGGAGGSPLGGAANTASTFGGGGGGSASAGGASVIGGGGGGGSGGSNAGGAVVYGGGGGGGSTSSGAGGAGGTSMYGGAGGAGANESSGNTAVAGTAPGGGGGGCGASGTAGTGARGEVRVWVIRT